MVKLNTPYIHTFNNKSKLVKTEMKSEIAERIMDGTSKETKEAVADNLMLNTIENKLRLFAQYFNQRVCHRRGAVMEQAEFNTSVILSNLDIIEISEYYLTLKPLSSISNEDAQQIKRFDGGIVEDFHKDAKSFTNDYNMFGFLSQHEADVLRKLGYACDYDDISVENQIEFGWIKLER